MARLLFGATAAEESKKGDSPPRPWPSKDVVWASEEDSSELNDRTLQDFCRRAIVNTVVITAPNVDVTSLQQLIPNETAVRIEPPK